MIGWPQFWMPTDTARLIYETAQSAWFGWKNGPSVRIGQFSTWNYLTDTLIYPPVAQNLNGNTSLLDYLIWRRLVIEGREFNATEAGEVGLATAQLPEEACDEAVQGFEQSLGWITPQATQSVLHCLRTDTREADMASLVSSVADPGFKDRVCAYRTQVSKPR